MYALLVVMHTVKMDKKSVNPNIGCNVTQCKYHCGESQNCSLDGITVSKQTSNANTKKETICNSFERRSGQSLF